MAGVITKSTKAKSICGYSKLAIWKWLQEQVCLLM